MGLLIRKGTENDIKEMDTLMYEGDEHHIVNLPHKFRKSDESREEFIIDKLNDEESNIFVCECEGDIVGLIITRVMKTPDVSIFIPREFGWIENLIVKEKSRGLGIGKKLMDEAEDWLKSRGVKEIELNVYNFNKGAIALYEKLGYIDLSKKMIKKI
ncbi:GNAT family N-acetyltransferase [Oceanirhabdus sp. W0125-5]|uniref:GNAT family N-acetyltransferase n=1 Tax=Oceanirhabdus sp. W0125-5 TaxID=2999116 RepID=UPI0022F2EAE6|nr:GNAT family N-acetyltransferase [Oceanirhabdus sp. W0125-5]WBW97340.1 GNAT family N-acetyltransferase [Oceanirhabdus sp. W0125-5]